MAGNQLGKGHMMWEVIVQETRDIAYGREHRIPSYNLELARKVADIYDDGRTFVAIMPTVSNPTMREGK